MPGGGGTGENEAWGELPACGCGAATTGAAGAGGICGGADGMGGGVATALGGGGVENGGGFDGEGGTNGVGTVDGFRSNSWATARSAGEEERMTDCGGLPASVRGASPDCGCDCEGDGVGNGGNTSRCATGLEGESGTKPNARVATCRGGGTGPLGGRTVVVGRAWLAAPGVAEMAATWPVPSAVRSAPSIDTSLGARAGGGRGGASIRDATGPPGGGAARAASASCRTRTRVSARTLRPSLLVTDSRRTISISSAGDRPGLRRRLEAARHRVAQALREMGRSTWSEGSDGSAMARSTSTSGSATRWMAFLRARSSQSRSDAA